MQSKKTITKINESDSTTFVVCLECGTKYPQVTHTHLKHAHGISLNDYIAKYELLKKQLFSEKVAELKKVTLENLIKKYGKEEGTKKWNTYKKKQALSNSFEYKQQKYGWTIEQYNEYNQTRASTKANFIKRHGAEEGTRRWNNYRKRQSYAGVTEEYFVEKFGTIEGSKKYKEICEQKCHSLENYIQKHGEIIGKERWERYCKKMSECNTGRQSKIANDLFMRLLELLPSERQSSVFFDKKNFEYFFARKGCKTVFVDFYDASTKKIIEFAGDYWHGNPKVYAPDFYNNQAAQTANQLWEKTLERNKMLESIHGCKVLLVWESDLSENEEATIKKCLDFLSNE